MEKKKLIQKLFDLIFFHIHSVKIGCDEKLLLGRIFLFMIGIFDIIFLLQIIVLFIVWDIICINFLEVRNSIFQNFFIWYSKYFKLLL
jgi:hypothetical protein